MKISVLIMLALQSMSQPQGQEYIEETKYHHVCIRNPQQCEKPNNYIKDMEPEQIKQTITIFSDDLFEQAGEPIIVQSTTLQILRKIPGATGPNSDKLVDGKLYIRKDKKNVAKMFQEQGISYKHLLSSFTDKEHKIMSKLSEHENILNYYGIVYSQHMHDEGHLPEAIFEYVESTQTGSDQSGEFQRNYLFTKSDYFQDIENVKKYMYQLISALDYVHSKGIIHRDIKPSNIILNTDGNVKLIDFDTSKFFHGTDKQTSSRFGTRGYRAPETQLEQEKHDYRVDIYSAGCVMLAMFMQEDPYFYNMAHEDDWHATMLVRGVQALRDIDYDNAMYDEDFNEKWSFIKPFSLFESFKKQQPDKVKENFNDYWQAFEVIEKMLTVDYHMRPMGWQLMKHPFFGHYHQTSKWYTKDFNSNPPDKDMIDDL